MIARADARHVQHGAALVEFAIVCPLLLLVLFGIVEVGLLFGDQATIAQAAREACRSAALGSQTGIAQSRAVSAAPGVPLTTANVTLEKSTDGTTWTALGNTGGSGGTNDAVTGNLVRATVTYDHPLITSYVFAGNTKTLTAQMVMQRE